VVDKVIFDKTPGSDAVVKKIIAEGGSWGTHGNVIIAQSLKELADALGQAGVYRGAFLKTIEEYNRAVDGKTQEDLAVSHYTGTILVAMPYELPLSMRSRPRKPYVTFGGVRINEHGQALDPQGVPVPGLYAPPPLGGGIQKRNLCGRNWYGGRLRLSGRQACRAGTEATWDREVFKDEHQGKRDKGAHTTTT